MATGAPNAILDINSLDRYTGQPVTNYNLVNARITSGLSLVIINAGFLTVGAEITGTGIQNDTLVTYVSPLGTQAQISKPATQTNVNVTITQAVTTSSALQPVSNSLQSQYENTVPYSNSFTIQSPGALIYGYISRIVVSQIQIQYNVPTIVTARDILDLTRSNDVFYIADITQTAPAEIVNIPFGFYTPTELAAVLQVQIQGTAIGALANITVTFDETDGFVFQSTSVPTNGFYFPDVEELQTTPALQLSRQAVDRVLRTYRTLGITIKNSFAQTVIATTQRSQEYPNFLYTPYIDICSDVLTNYQTIKDTNTSPQKPKGLVARVYLSSVGNPQTTTPNSALGSAPFVVTVDLNSPKIIKWSPDVAVPSIDFQLLDQYGDLLPGADLGYSTEFQMTLLCVEGREWNS